MRFLLNDELASTLNRRRVFGEDPVVLPCSLRKRKANPRENHHENTGCPPNSHRIAFGYPPEHLSISWLAPRWHHARPKQQELDGLHEQRGANFVPEGGGAQDRVKRLTRP